MKITSVRGMHPQGPDKTIYWARIESVLRETVQQYGFHEIRFPVVEKTELFCRAVGQATDIVEKEMYTFEDRNGESLSLRPEGTASCVKAAIECGLLSGQTQKLWYMGPMFRHERPQKGRYRQFHQFGVENFGDSHPSALVELILLVERFWKALQFNDIELQINSLGSTECRAQYRELLVEFFNQHRARLDEDSLRRLETNPLRILDSKNPEIHALVQEAPKLLEHLDEQSSNELNYVRDCLDMNGVRYRLNPHLVRGLDYYNGVVMEWVTDKLGAQGTLCAGGRYDGLIKQLGGRTTPAAGFAIGLERLLCLMEETQMLSDSQNPEVYFVTMGEHTTKQALVLKEQLHNDIPRCTMRMNTAVGSFKSQMKRADKSGARIAVILGEDEVTRKEVTIKYLREDRPQETIAQKELKNFIEINLR